MGDNRHAWHDVVDELAQMPDVAARLAAEHQPSEDGRCTACRTPGYGTPEAAWPCSLHRLAEAALSAEKSAEQVVVADLSRTLSGPG